jgi:hypothetical protein
VISGVDFCACACAVIAVLTMSLQTARSTGGVAWASRAAHSCHRKHVVCVRAADALVCCSEVRVVTEVDERMQVEAAVISMAVSQVCGSCACVRACMCACVRVIAHVQTTQTQETYFSDLDTPPASTTGSDALRASRLTEDDVDDDTDVYGIATSSARTSEADNDDDNIKKSSWLKRFVKSKLSRKSRAAVTSSGGAVSAMPPPSPLSQSGDGAGRRLHKVSM